MRLFDHMLTSKQFRSMNKIEGAFETNSHTPSFVNFNISENEVHFVNNCGTKINSSIYNREDIFNN